MVARTTQKKMSEIMKEMADRILSKPADLVSDEAAHVALFLASAAWNNVKCSGRRRMPYRAAIRKIAGKRDIRQDLKNEPDALLAELEEFARKNYPDDHREIVVCGTTPRGTIRVEWTDSPVEPPANKTRWFLPRGRQ